MLIAVVLLPLIAAGLVFVLSGNRSRITVLVLTAVAHLGFVISFWRKDPGARFQGFLSMDALGLLVLSIISVLFAMVALYLTSYLKPATERSKRDFIGCLLVFLSAMTLVTVSRHLGPLWIGIEATTLAGVPLINFERTPQSIEATWKYIMICSVGIALALLGTYFLAVSAVDVQTLLLDKLLSHAAQLSLPWLKISAIFLLIGYGTKMGLAPMHTWLPDAHSQAPSPVSALLSGALLNCAFLGVLRVGQVCHAAGQTQFFSSMLILLGIISLGIAYVFIWGQGDYKRMLAYSSVEHMGILAIGIGLGATGIYGSMLHAVNNAFSKGFIFLVTGNLYRQYRSRRVNDVRGVLHSYPMTGVLLLAGFLAVSGVPPFGTFLSELIILNAAVAGRHYAVAFFYILFLSLIFMGMAGIILKMAQGLPPERALNQTYKESPGTTLPILFLALIVVMLGFYVPPFLNEVLQKASGLLQG